MKAGVSGLRRLFVSHAQCAVSLEDKELARNLMKDRQYGSC